MDVVLLSRIQFAVTVAYHFLFVPLSIGVGLILVLAERRYFKSGNEEDKAAADFWIRLFTATFAVGVATGIAMEFAFGTNWATYSRFVGDIFGAPLAAEGLFAFFLESTFLAVLLFGRHRVSKRFFYTSTWLVWAGSMLSALWIIIANSWMQTPAGYEVVGTGVERKAVLTDFFAAALNPTTLPRYAHTIDAVLTVGGFVAIALGAYYLRRGVHVDFAKKSIATGLGVAALFTALMLPIGHWQAVAVVETQPSKIAAFEGHWDDGPMSLGLLGYVDEASGKTVALEIPGGVNLLAGDLSRSRSFEGLNSFDPQNRPPLQLTYQTYHGMILLWGAMVLGLALLWFANRRGKLAESKRLLTALMWSPVIPMLAIQLGWAAAEVGRQPWIVYPVGLDAAAINSGAGDAVALRTLDAISKAVPAGEVLTTLLLFVAFYTLIYVAWIRVVVRFIKAGPVSAGRQGDEPVPARFGDGAAAAVAFDASKGVE